MCHTAVTDRNEINFMSNFLKECTLLERCTK